MTDTSPMKSVAARGYEVVERVAAMLDGGAEAKVFASGLAAVVAFFETVESGQHVVAPRMMYHGAQDWLRRLVEKRGVEVDFFDATDPAALSETVRAGRTSVVNGPPPRIEVRWPAPPDGAQFCSVTSAAAISASEQRP